MKKLITVALSTSIILNLAVAVVLSLLMVKYIDMNKVKPPLIINQAFGIKQGMTLADLQNYSPKKDETESEDEVGLLYRIQNPPKIYPGFEGGLSVALSKKSKVCIVLLRADDMDIVKARILYLNVKRDLIDKYGSEYVKASSKEKDEFPDFTIKDEKGSGFIELSGYATESKVNLTLGYAFSNYLSCNLKNPIEEVSPETKAERLKGL